jgi:hypothetical protein
VDGSFAPFTTGVKHLTPSKPFLSFFLLRFDVINGKAFTVERPIHRRTNACGTRRALNKNRILDNTIGCSDVHEAI